MILSSAATWKLGISRKEVSARPTHLPMVEYKSQISDNLLHCCRDYGAVQLKDPLKTVEKENMEWDTSTRC
jgi:hypothetical protein